MHNTANKTLTTSCYEPMNSTVIDTPVPNLKGYNEETIPLTYKEENDSKLHYCPDDIIIEINLADNATETSIVEYQSYQANGSTKL